jgi:hypothetical protein
VPIPTLDGAKGSPVKPTLAFEGSRRVLRLSLRPLFVAVKDNHQKHK